MNATDRRARCDRTSTGQPDAPAPGHRRPVKPRSSAALLPELLALAQARKRTNDNNEYQYVLFIR